MEEGLLFSDGASVVTFFVDEPTVLPPLIEARQPPLATLDEADAFIEYELNTDVWDVANDRRRMAALMKASSIIRNLNIDECYYMHNNIKHATVLIAIQLLSGVDPESLLSNDNVVTSTIGVVSKSLRTTETAQHIIAGVPSHTAWNMLVPFLNNQTSVRLSRVD